MITLSRPRAARPALLGRLHGVLLLVLGAAVLVLLLYGTEGHRARLAAEALGVVLGAAIAAVVSGLSRPSPAVVTRAYVRLSRHVRRILLAGMGLLFGFATITAAIRQVAPGLREAPLLGGVVTLDWVLSLTMLAIAGAALLLLGALTLAAQPSAPVAAIVDSGRIVERLWAAANSDRSEALRACFVDGEGGDALYRRWQALAGANGSGQAVLVRSATLWGCTLSEWRSPSDGAGEAGHWVLIAREHGGRVASGDYYRPCADGAAELATALPRGGL